MTPTIPSDVWGFFDIIASGAMMFGLAIYNKRLTARQSRELKQSQHNPETHTDQIAKLEDAERERQRINQEQQSFNTEISRKIDVLVDQVSNDHDTNLRDDLDGVKVVVVECKSAIHRIGDEVRIDREEREKLARSHYKLSARVENSIAKHHPDHEKD